MNSLALRRGARLPRSLQRGQSAIIILLLVGMAVSALVFGMAKPGKESLDASNKTAAALAKAKEALIGYAASDPNQPGILPCPDNDNDGSADSPCGATGVTAIGRLPWRTLGLPDLRDGYGECLWYAVSSNFKNSGVSGPAQLNSDSPGTLAVSESDGTISLPASMVVAIVVAPGPMLPGQNRAAVGTTVCGGNATPANYLDTITVGGTTYNNATGGGTNNFISAPPLVPLTQLNDKLLPITTDALFNVVNIRVVKDIRLALLNYRAANGYYPRANPYTDGTFSCNNGTYHGRLPLTLATCTQGIFGPIPNWGGSLPAWVAPNRWNQVTHYAVAEGCTYAPGLVGAAITALCNTVGADLLGTLIGGGTQPLTITGVSTNVQAVTIISGRAFPAQTHPCTTAANCFADDGDTSNSNLNNNYIIPARFPQTNDRLAAICASNSSCNAMP